MRFQKLFFFTLLLFSKLLIASDTADIIIFSYNRPMQLYACLESIEKNVSETRHIFVIYRASSDGYQTSYEEVKNRFPQAEFYLQPNSNPADSFKPLVLKLGFDQTLSHADYLIFCTDDIIVKEEISLSEGILFLQQSKSYGLYYRLGKNTTYCYMNNEPHRMPRFIDLDKNLLMWQFAMSSGDFNYPHSVDFTLYPKRFIKQQLECLDYKNPNTMEGVWAAHANHYHRGICYSISKIVNTPMNIVNESERGNRHFALYTSEALQEKFEQGLKIDISPLMNMVNQSAHIDYCPTFILR